jgi:hypothetical protein
MTIHQQRRNPRFSHLLEKSCAPSFGTNEGLSLGEYHGTGPHDQFCLIYGDNEEAEDTKCKSEAREEMKMFPLAQQFETPYQHPD